MEKAGNAVSETQFIILYSFYFLEESRQNKFIFRFGLISLQLIRTHVLFSYLREMHRNCAIRLQASGELGDRGLLNQF